MARGDFVAKGDSGSKPPKAIQYGVQSPPGRSSTGGSMANERTGGKRAGLSARAVPAAVKKGR